MVDKGLIRMIVEIGCQLEDINRGGGLEISEVFRIGCGRNC